ncbi:hypothetical protein XaplCFBP3122_06250 [Xanthomonas arboricola pv. populi]|uniref:Uncharacterized protein n=1 Tax=Xanthomonas arboricola pv. populi TaxID=487823 RepID=A0A2S6Z7W8_9XANT|nr:hypothetical protein [Xanthomonas arboricola]PPT77555.1 hypothetical protein XaplCFBP3122_06250 [Xanthomonas arboricola pv. populi]
MAETPSGFDERIERQLDALAQAGRRSLSRRARRSSWRRATDWALRSSLVVPLLALPWAGLGRADAGWVLVACLLLPLLVMTAVQALASLRRRDDRAAALELADRTVGARGRIDAAGQFVRERDRDPFRQAALLDAVPWIERALASPLALPPATPPRRDRRLWLFPLAAVLLLAAAATLQNGQRPGAAPVDASGSAGSMPAPARFAEAPLAQSRTLVADAGRRSARQPHAAAIAAQMAGTTDAAATAANSVASPAAAGAAAAQAQRAAAAAAQARPAGTPAQPRAASAGERDADGSGGRTAASGGQTENSEQSAAMSIDATASAADGGEDRPDDRRQDPSEPSSGNPGQNGMTAAGAAPKAGSQDADGQGRQQRQNPSQKGDQGQSQGQSQRPGQGQGQGQGQEEGQKRTRGISGLLLGVPMEDQLTGSANRGRVRSITRPAEAAAAGPAAGPAQARGSGQGDVGGIGHRAASAGDERLVRDYFLRRRAAAAAAPEPVR